MSRKELKRDRRSRNEFQEDFDSSLDELTDSFSESLDRIADDFEQSVSSKPELPDMDDDSLVDDSDEDEAERVGLISRLASVGRFFPVQKVGALLRAVPSLFGKAGRLLMSGGKKALGFFVWIGSFLVFRDDEEDEEVAAESPSGGSVVHPVPTTREIQKPKPVAVSKTSDRVAENELIDDTEFDEGPGWSWKIKVAALAALVLAGTGGFFALKPLLSSNTEIAAHSGDPTDSPPVIGNGVENGAANGVENGIPKETISPREAKPEGVIAANVQTPDPPKDPKASAPKSADPKPADPKVGNKKPQESKDPKTSAPKPDPKAENKKPKEPKDPKDTVPKTDPPSVAESAPDPSPTPGLPFFQPVMDSPEETAPSAFAVSSNPFASAFDVVPVTQPESVESATPSNDRPALGVWDPIGPLSQPEEVAAAPAPETPTSPPEIFMDTPPAATVPETAADPGINVPKDETPRSNIPPAPKLEELARFSVPKPEETSEIPRTPDPIGDVPSLEPIVPQLSRLEPLGEDFVAATPPERSLAIPDDKIAQKFRAEEFRTEEFRTEELGSAPTPRNVDVSIPKWDVDDSITALDPPPVPEVVPVIPASGSVKHGAAAAPIPSTNVEPSLSIPGDPAPGALATFGTPKPVSNAVDNTVSNTDSNSPSPTAFSALSLPPSETTPARETPTTPFYVPPPVDRSVAASTPSPMSSGNSDEVPIPGIESVPFVADAGSALEIPRNELQPLTTGNLEPLTTVQPLAAAPLHPDHETLARTDPPLGNQFQQRVRELRNSNAETETPQLKFGDATGGATRFNRQASATNISTNASTGPQPFSVPMATDDPQSNPLYNLNPTGKAAANGVDPTSLPPDSAAPQAVLASGHPGYGRSISQDVPASVSVERESKVSLAPSLADRASTYRSKIEKEITQSPEETELYTVREGDTYMTISDRKYSTSLLYRALAVHNRKRGVDWVPQPGTVIEIPTAEYLKTNYAEVLMRSGNERRTRTSSNTNSLNRTTQIGGRYTTREGDSVFRIATNQLRDSSRWQEVMELNSDRIQSPTKIPAGVELVLPAVNTVSHSTASVERGLVE